MLGSTKLLTISNPKTSKSVEYGYLTAVMNLAPARSAGYGNVCPHASKGCESACLNTAGAKLYLRGKLVARAKRTRFYFENRKGFYERLVKEIAAFERKANRLNLKPAIRLNCTSDLRFPRWIYESFPLVQFYDYTANFKAEPRAVNHHLTYSVKETTKDEEWLMLIEQGKNVAIVFAGPSKRQRDNGATVLPTSYKGVPVVTGLLHDLRFLDKKQKNGKGVIVGLKPLGKAKKDKSGFVKKTPYNRYWLTISECKDVA